MSVTLLSILTVLIFAQPEDAPSSQPSSAPASRPAEPAWLLAQIHRPAEAKDDQSYILWCRGKRLELLAKAADATDHEAATRLRLAAANTALSMETEPFVSRWLLGIAGPQDVEGIRLGLEHAREDLRKVSENGAGVGESDADRRSPQRAMPEALQAFATALDSIWSDASPEEAIASRQAAATGLAVLLEDERRDVAAAALLWQAVIYKEMGQMDRAFQLLPAATERLSRDARTYQFQARLLRCRLLAERGAHAAAAALLLRVEESVTDWFQSEAEQQVATHAAMLGRSQVIEMWKRSLDPAKDTSEITWCDRAADRLASDATEAANPVYVLGLNRTIPMLGPAPAETEDGPAAQPAEAAEEE